MPVCNRCGTKIGIFSSRSFSKATERCNICDSEVRLARQDFRSAFLEFASDGVLSTDEWDHLTKQASNRRLPLGEALSYISNDAIELIGRVLEITCDDGIITQDEKRYVDYLMGLLRLPPEFVERTRSLITQLRLLSDITKGQLPIVQPSIFLDVGEVCHLETDAFYTNTGVKSFQEKEGRVVVSDQKLRFVSHQGGFEIKWNKVLSTVVHDGRIFIETSGRQGNGFYSVDHPVTTEALLSHLIQASREEPKRTTRTKKQSPQPKHPEASKSPHDVLRVSLNATREELAVAYREMAKLYHPDKVASLAPEFKVLAETRMKEINVAYDILVRGLCNGLLF